MVAAVVGVVVTLVASVAPAVKASRVAPLAALRDVAVDRSGASWVRGLLGVVVAGTGIAATIGGTAGAGSLALTGLGALLVVVGFVLLGPVVARPVAGVLGGPLTLRRGMSGSLARRNAMRNPRRTAGTASALMVGVAVVTLFTVVAASVKQSIDDTVSEQFAGDLVIAQTDFSGAGLTPELEPAVGALPEVDVATGMGIAPVAVDGDDTVASVIDPASFGRVLDVDVSQGSIDDLGDREVALFADYAVGPWPRSRRCVARVVRGRRHRRAHGRGDLRQRRAGGRRGPARGDVCAARGEPRQRRGAAHRPGRRRVDRRRGGRHPAGRRPVRGARRAGPPGVRRLGCRRGRPDPDRHLRAAGHGHRDRPHGHRQHAVAVDPRAHPRAGAAPGRGAEPPAAAPDGARRGAGGGPVRHRRRARPGDLPGLGDGEDDRGRRGTGGIRGPGRAARPWWWPSAPSSGWSRRSAPPAGPPGSTSSRRSQRTSERSPDRPVVSQPATGPRSPLPRGLRRVRAAGSGGDVPARTVPAFGCAGIRRLGTPVRLRAGCLRARRVASPPAGRYQLPPPPPPAPPPTPPPPKPPPPKPPPPLDDGAVAADVVDASSNGAM